MSIFNKRPLGLILCIISGGFSLFSAVDDTARIILAILALLLLAYSLLFNKSAIFRVSVISLIISFILSAVYFGIVFYPNVTEKSESVTVVGKVTELDLSSSYTKVLDVETESIDGNHTTIKILVYLNDTDAFVPVGADVKFQTKLSRFNSGQDFDFEKYYAAKGYSARATIDKIEILSDESFVLGYEMARVRDKICNYIASLTDDDDAAGLLSALLIGETERMDNSLELDFRRMGITHILVLSGTHVSMLCMGLLFLLKLLGIGKRKAIIVSMFFTLAFMALVGFPPSVCRAGIMFILSSVIYLLSGAKDNITSLFAALFVIILIDPCASLDLGLWLSVIATFGILLAVELFGNEYDTSKGIKKLLKLAGFSLAISFFAIGMTMGISVLCFGNVSVLGPVTTLIFSFLTEIYIYLGLVTMCLGNVLPFLGSAMSIFYKAIVAIGAFFSDLPMIYPSGEFVPVKILSVALTAGFVIFALIRLKHRRIQVFALIALMTATIGLSVILTSVSESKQQIIYEGTDSDKIIVSDGDTTSFVDSSDINVTTAYEAYRLLTENHITELDYYVINSYSYSLPHGLDELLSSIKIKNVILPLPMNDKEDSIARKAYDVVSCYRSSVSFHKTQETAYIGNVKFVSVVRTALGDDPRSAFTLEYRDQLYSYVSCGAFNALPETKALLYLSKVIILGSYGTSYSDPLMVEDVAQRLELFILRSDRVILHESVYSKTNVIISNETQYINLN